MEIHLGSITLPGIGFANRRSNRNTAVAFALPKGHQVRMLRLYVPSADQIFYALGHGAAFDIAADGLGLPFLGAAAGPPRDVLVAAGTEDLTLMLYSTTGNPSVRVIGVAR